MSIMVPLVLLLFCLTGTIPLIEVLGKVLGWTVWGVWSFVQFFLYREDLREKIVAEPDRIKATWQGGSISTRVVALRCSEPNLSDLNRMTRETKFEIKISDNKCHVPFCKANGPHSDHVEERWHQAALRELPKFARAAAQDAAARGDAVVTARYLSLAEMTEWPRNGVYAYGPLAPLAMMPQSFLVSIEEAVRSEVVAEAKYLYQDALEKRDAYLQTIARGNAGCSE